MTSTVYPVLLFGSIFVLGLAIDWVRAARLTSARLRAIWDSVGGLLFWGVLFSNVGGIGAAFLYGFTAVGILPYVWIAWAVVAGIEVVILGIELNRLARARDSDGHS